jgi:hypothetical protein
MPRLIQIKDYRVRFATCSRGFNEWRSNITVSTSDSSTSCDIRFVEDPATWQQFESVNETGWSQLYLPASDFANANLFGTVRALNESLPTARKLRVLLGDPPLSGQANERGPAWRGEVNARDAHFAEVVEDQVLARGQRALLIAGAAHFARISDAAPPEGNVVQRLELKYPGTIFVVVPHVIFDETRAVRPDEVRELEARLAAWPVASLATVHGWLGGLDAYLHFDNTAQIVDPDGTERLVRVPYIGPDGTPVTKLQLSEMADALLYLGPQEPLTFTPPANSLTRRWLDPTDLSASQLAIARRNTDKSVLLQQSQPAATGLTQSI